MAPIGSLFSGCGAFFINSAAFTNIFPTFPEVANFFAPIKANALGSNIEANRPILSVKLNKLFLSAT